MGQSARIYEKILDRHTVKFPSDSLVAVPRFNGIRNGYKHWLNGNFTIINPTNTWWKRDECIGSIPTRCKHNAMIISSGDDVLGHVQLSTSFLIVLKLKTIPPPPVM